MYDFVSEGEELKRMARSSIKLEQSYIVLRPVL
jgi:hypothetical protein